jgi:uncharacterized protein YwqG
MKDLYKIIEITTSERKYCQIFSDEYYMKQLERFKRYSPDLTIDKLKNRDKAEYDNYSDINIPIGCSMIGGPIVDLPPDIEYPDGYIFMAQLNCSEIKPYDKIGLLPENGFLYFFIKKYGYDGMVFYTQKNKNLLKRIVKEHTDLFFYGKIVKEYKIDTETIETRYEINEGKREWNYFKGDELSKIYGIYSNCQASEKEIINFMEDENRILLLQIGSNYFDEGCQSVFININDLINKEFDKCVFEYNQS